MQQMPDGRAFGFLPRHNWGIDILQPFRFMLHVPFVLQDAQHGAYRRIAGRIVHTLPHFGSGGFSALVEDLHNLPFSPA